MRVYFEKPRTTTGWKGLINDPHLDGSDDVQRRPAHRPRAAARRRSSSACRSAASCSTRSRRSTSPTPSPGARSARAPPRARSTASSPPASRCRSASRTAPTATSRSPSTRCARPRPPHAFAGIDADGTPAILHTTRQPGLPRDPARRPRSAQLRRRGVAGALGSCARPGCRAGHDRRLPRQQRQGPRAPAAGRRRRRRPGRRGERRDRRRDARVLPRRRAARTSTRRRELTYGQSITDACMDWDTTEECWSSSPPRVRGAARTGPGLTVAVVGVGLIGGLDRPGGARAARRRRGGAGSRPVSGSSAGERGRWTEPPARSPRPSRALRQCSSRRPSAPCPTWSRRARRRRPRTAW